MRYITELPFGFPGRIFRSPMPFGAYDPKGEALHEFKQKEISVVVLLAEDEECLRKARRNLRSIYIQEGFQVVHLPVPDFGVPLKDDLDPVITSTVDYARGGHNIAVHCSAGIGRTGLFVAYLAKRVFGFSGTEAINWVRQYIPGAVETSEQRQLIIDEG